MADMNLDGHKLHLHPLRVAEWMKTGDTFPIHIEVGVTGRCDQNCVFCALDYVDHNTDIDKNIMLSAIDDMGRRDVRPAEFGGQDMPLVASLMFGGEGEPLLHPNIGDFVRRADSVGIDTAITTNGSHLRGAKMKSVIPYLSWIKVSVDGGNADSYARIHGVAPKNFEKLMGNLEETVRFRDENKFPATIGTQMVVVKEGVKDAANLAKRLSEIGVDYLAVKPYSHHPSSNHEDLSIPVGVYDSLENMMSPYSNERFKVKFRRATAERIVEGNAYPKCLGLPFITLIDASGNILPCNLFYDDKEFSYGNLNSEGFVDIWKGEKRKEVLEKIGRQGVSNCRPGCRCDSGNRYLDRLGHPDAHDNFT